MMNRYLWTFLATIGMGTMGLAGPAQALLFDADGSGPATPVDIGGSIRLGSLASRAWFEIGPTAGA